MINARHTALYSILFFNLVADEICMLSRTINFLSVFLRTPRIDVHVCNIGKI